MCAINKFLLFLALMLLLVTPIAAAEGHYKQSKVIDKTAESYKIITSAPKNIKGNISVTDSDTLNYSITKLDSNSISIKRIEKNNEHTKANIKIKLGYLQTLPGYNGKEIACGNLVNGTLTNYQLIDIKSHTSGSTVIVPATFSEVIINGMTGWYTKSVSNINPVNTTISFAVQNATGAYIQTAAPPAYMVWNESNISTYPTPSKWLLLWTLDGNSTGATDISGNSRSGTIVAAKTTSDRHGTAGKALYFDNNDDYVTYNYSDTLYTNLTAFYGYKVTGYADDCLTDLRTAAGVGREGWYTHNNIYKINNATSVNTLNSSSGTWNYAFTDLGSSQTNWVWLGARYTLANDFGGWLDAFGLYNGTLSSTSQRHISMGYSGIKVKSNTGTLTPLSTSNQSISAGSTITSITLQSNNDTLRSFTFAAPFQQNYTAIREWDSSTTTHRTDISFTPQTNVTTGTLRYTVDNSYRYGAPTLSSNDAGASVSQTSNVLSISLGAIAAGTNKYYNVSAPINQRAITVMAPTDHTLEATTGDSINFNISTNGTTDIVWKRNGTIVETDTNTTTGLYTFSEVSEGSYSVVAEVPGDTESWTIDITPISLLSHYPSSSIQSMKVNETMQFNATSSGSTEFEWLVNGTLMETDSATTDAYYNFTPNASGTYNVTVRIPADDNGWTVLVTPAILAALGVIALLSFFTFAFGYLKRR